MISFLALGTVLSASAQDMNNLVENPSFEQTEGRIKRGGAIALRLVGCLQQQRLRIYFPQVTKKVMGLQITIWGWKKRKMAKTMQDLEHSVIMTKKLGIMCRLN